MLFICPGSIIFKQPEPRIIRCPSCGEEVEIWTDEIKARCRKCKTAVSREQAQTCLDWCKYAKECAGEQVYNKYMKNKTITKQAKIKK